MMMKHRATEENLNCDGKPISKVFIRILAIVCIALAWPDFKIADTAIILAKPHTKQSPLPQGAPRFLTSPEVPKTSSAGKPAQKRNPSPSELEQGEESNPVSLTEITGSNVGTIALVSLTRSLKQNKKDQASLAKTRTTNSKRLGCSSSGSKSKSSNTSTSKSKVKSLGTHSTKSKSKSRGKPSSKCQESKSSDSKVSSPNKYSSKSKLKSPRSSSSKSKSKSKSPSSSSSKSKSKWKTPRSPTSKFKPKSPKMPSSKSKRKPNPSYPLLVKNPRAYTTPSLHQSKNPSKKPSTKPSKRPSQKPSNGPSLRPSAKPSKWRSQKPSNGPSLRPSAKSSRRPSLKPSESKKPSQKPSNGPSLKPSQNPSRGPSLKPSTSTKPSQNPSRKPSQKPSNSLQPSQKPSGIPSLKPSKSKKPSRMPSRKPSKKPSRKPSRKPSKKPSRKPSKKPSRKPSKRPSCHANTLCPDGYCGCNCKIYGQACCPSDSHFNGTHCIDCTCGFCDHNQIHCCEFNKNGNNCVNNKTSDNQDCGLNKEFFAAVPDSGEVCSNGAKFPEQCACKVNSARLCAPLSFTSSCQLCTAFDFANLPFSCSSAKCCTNCRDCMVTHCNIPQCNAANSSNTEHDWRECFRHCSDAVRQDTCGTQCGH